MNIPLINSNSKQDINTSLIAIRNAINELARVKESESVEDLQRQINIINQQITNFNSEFSAINTHLNTIDTNILNLQPVDTVASGNLHSVTSNGVFNALKPIPKTANQYMVKGDGVADIDLVNVGIRLNKVTTSQYHLHFEPLRFTAKANPPQGYFAIADFSNALVQLYSDSRNQNFSNEVLIYIVDETNGTYVIASCYILNKVLFIRFFLPFNQSFSFIEGHSYAMIGDIDLWLA